MRLYLMDKNRIYKFSLPQKVFGSYLFTYKDELTKVENMLNIESDNNNYKLKSSSNINVISNGNVVSEVILANYNCIRFKDENNKIERKLFCLPSNDSNVYKYSMENVDTITIGKNPNCTIFYNNPEVANNHLNIVNSNGEYYAVASADINACSFLNDIKIVKNARLHVGDVIFIEGLKIIWMKKFIVVNNPNGCIKVQQLNQYFDNNYLDNTKYSSVSEEENGIELYKEEEYFTHTPRLRTVFEREEVVIDAPPANQNPNEDLPWVLSLGTGLTMAASSIFMLYQYSYNLISGNTSYALGIPMIILALLMLFSSVLIPRLTRRYQKKKRIEREKLRQEKYTAYLQKKEEHIQLKLGEQASVISDNNITLAKCRENIIAKSRTVWNKEIKDNDFLDVRVGVGTFPADISIKAPEEHFSLDEDNLTNLVYELSDKYKVIENVPVTISLTTNNIVSFLFECNFKKSFIDGLILQIVTHHSALDLKIVLFTNEENSQQWDYIKKLPHNWNDDKTVRFFSTNLDEQKVVISFLEKEFLNRQQLVTNNKQEKQSNVQDERSVDKEKPYTKFDSYYLILTDDYRSLRETNFIDEFLKENTNLGFSLVMFDDSMRNLPQECDYFVVIDEKECGVFNKELKASSLIKFKAEYDESIDMIDMATRLSNIPIQSKEAAKSLPSTLNFLEMYNVGKIEQLNILNRWKNNNPTTSLAAPIGVHTNGDLFNLDLHEKYDGPHGLIAGSTGSGKSEFIITYILSMALNYHPDEVQFVLIDYKGGGLTGAFENKETGIHLPHLAGTITNLDSSEMNRALVSIESELKRRQAKFNEVRDSVGESTMDIYKYQSLYREGVIKDPISHLFIISDEFAELKSQQPEFMSQLISTSRIGRSLGVHLILATQKPSGVVNEQIWSNSKFKICLKVQSRGDSMEVLKRPDAASIKEAGRFYLQVGYDEYFDIGQSGWSGAKYIPSDRIAKKVDDSINFVNNCGTVVKTANDLVVTDENQKKYGDQITSLVKYLYSVSKSENITSRKMWLDPLPEPIYLQNVINKYNFTITPYNFNIVLGEYDAPRRQEQGLFAIDISNKNTLIYGLNDSGKEDFIGTLVYSAMISHDPKTLNFYIANFGSETLSIFNTMPHVGDVLITNDSDKLDALIKMLNNEYEKRKKLFVDYSGSYIEYNRNNEKKLPLIVVVLNAFEGFVETYPRINDIFDSLFRDGAKCGITFIVSTSVNNCIKGRVTQYFENKICFRLANNLDYRNLLGSPKGLVPADKYGRAIATVGDENLEIQCALITNKEQINNVIRKTANIYNEKYDYKAKKLPVLPQICTVDEVLFEMKGLDVIPIGIEKNTLEVYVYDFTLNKINLIISNFINSHIYFVYALVREFLLNKNVNVKIIDGLGSYHGKYQGVEVYAGNFDAVINQMNRELQTEKSNQDTTIYMMIGIGSIKDKLSKEYKEIFDSIFSNVENYQKSIFLFIDDYASIKKIQVEEWYRNNVDNNYGIWLGDGADSQMAINITTLTYDDKKIKFPFIGYPIYKGNHMIVKYVVDGMEGMDEK